MFYFAAEKLAQTNVALTFPPSHAKPLSLIEKNAKEIHFENSKI